MHHENHTEEQGNFLTDMTQNINNPERIASALAGGALVAFGLKRGGALGAAASVLGGGMLFRGTTGHCHVYDAAGIDTNRHAANPDSPFGRGWMSGIVHITESVTVNKSPEELYQFWRNFENLPTFMKHLESVSVTEGNRSHWVAKAPLGQTVEWEAELTSDVPNERIGWKSVEGSDIANSGVVEFRPTKDRGTEVKVIMTYEAPGGKLGSFLAWLFGEEPSTQIHEDLRNFRSLMETGLIINVEGQTSGRREVMKSMTARA